MSKPPTFFRRCLDWLLARAGYSVNHGLRAVTAIPDTNGVSDVALDTRFREAVTQHINGDLEQAESGYRAVISLRPGHVDALHNMGVVSAQRGHFLEALDWIDRAIKADPSRLAPHVTHGNLLKDLQRNEDAVASFDRALALDSQSTDAWLGRAIALYGSRRHHEAMASFDRALVIDSPNAQALYGRGIVLASLRHFEEAVADYGRAIAIEPNHADAYSNRGIALAQLQRHEEALDSYHRALAINPRHADALNNRGALLMTRGDFSGASRDYAQLVEIAPNYKHGLGNLLLARLYCCDWADYQAVRGQLGRGVRTGQCEAQPFALVVASGDGADHLACAKTFVANAYAHQSSAMWTGGIYRHNRIRIAYLSADFREHAASYLIAELIEKHDRNRFEISAWSLSPAAEDDMRVRLRKAFDQFNDVADIGDLEVANRLRAEEIDIAVDLMGHTSGSRPGIYACRPAPLQATYLGYLGTTGADFMDYIIGDAEVIPESHEHYYTEKVVRLPDTFQVNDSKRKIAPQAPARGELGLPPSGFVFCCFNNTYKITPDMFDIWMRLLARIDGSILWLVAGDYAAGNLRAEASARGIDPARLVFAMRMALPDHLARLQHADLFLDTLPYNAGATASDALWAGVPVLTCAGSSFPGRVAASLLRAIGLPELITSSHTEYEMLAYQLATTPTRLAELRGRLARNRNSSPLFDTDRFKRHIESAYITMYERYQKGHAPQSFSVRPSA